MKWPDRGPWGRHGNCRWLDGESINPEQAMWYYWGDDNDDGRLSWRMDGDYKKKDETITHEHGHAIHLLVERGPQEAGFV